MDKSISHGVVKCLETVDRVNGSDDLHASLKAATWLVSHRHKKRWGDKTVTLKGAGGGEFRIILLIRM